MPIARLRVLPQLHRTRLLLQEREHAFKKGTPRIP